MWSTNFRHFGKYDSTSKSKTSSPPEIGPQTFAIPQGWANIRKTSSTVGRRVWNFFHGISGRLLPSVAIGTLIGGEVRGFFPDVNDNNRFTSAPVTITAEGLEFESTLSFDFDVDTLTIQKQNGRNLFINGGAHVTFFDFVLADPLLAIDSITVILDEFSTGGGSATLDEIHFSCCGGVEPSGHQRVVYQFSFATIPEPSTGLLLGSGLVALAVWRRRFR